MFIVVNCRILTVIKLLITFSSQREKKLEGFGDTCMIKQHSMFWFISISCCYFETMCKMYTESSK